jgi:hypothetical protein
MYFLAKSKDERTWTRVGPGIADFDAASQARREAVAADPYTSYRIDDEPDTEEQRAVRDRVLDQLAGCAGGIRESRASADPRDSWRHKDRGT